MRSSSGRTDPGCSLPRFPTIRTQRSAPRLHYFRGRHEFIRRTSRPHPNDAGTERDSVRPAADKVERSRRCSFINPWQTCSRSNRTRRRLSDHLRYSAGRRAECGARLRRGGPAASTGVPSDPGGSSMFQLVEQLGLRLDARREPVETLVIDHVEKLPTAN